MNSSTDPISNQLLAALPDDELKRWRHQLELVDLHLGQVLYESGSPLSHVYFPCTAIVSLLYLTESGESAEIAVVGNEGVVGIAFFMGGETTPNRAVVQSAGVCYRLKAAAIKAAFNLSAPVMHLLLRYTQALITQMSQTAVCNRHHSVDQQLCRWLLMNLDRLQGNELAMTQELIANMLGLRREGVTEAALKLTRAATSRCWIGRVSSFAPASAMPSSRQSTPACFQNARQPSRPSAPQGPMLRAAQGAVDTFSRSSPASARLTRYRFAAGSLPMLANTASSGPCLGHSARRQDALGLPASTLAIADLNRPALSVRKKASIARPTASSRASPNMAAPVSFSSCRTIRGSMVKQLNGWKS